MNTFNSTIFSKTILSLGLLFRVAGFYLIAQATSSVILLELVHIPSNYIANPENLALIPNIQQNLALAQGLGMFLGFLILPILYWNYFRTNADESDSLIKNVPRQGLYILASVCLLVATIPMIEQLSLFNKGLAFPEGFEKLETLLRTTEKGAETLTQLLVQYQSLTSFLLVFVVIAIIPAIGEEIVFRGIVQKELIDLWGNKHLAIWVGAFIFSFIHFQFFGFIPRMLLGVLFGYCYLWTNSLWIPIAMHFTNNALTLVVASFFSKSFLSSIDDADSFFDIRFFILYIVAQVILVVVYFKFIHKLKSATQAA
jgi:uncharacterized protein